MKRVMRLLGPVAAVGLLLGGCKVQEGGLGTAGELPAPIAPATAGPVTSDAAAAAPPIEPIGPPAQDAGVGKDGSVPPPSTPPPITPPPITPRPGSDAGPAMAVDAVKPAPPAKPDAAAGTDPVATPTPDTCAPRAGSNLPVQLHTRVRLAEDFTFDNDGQFLLFSNRDVLRLSGDNGNGNGNGGSGETLLLRNIVGVGGRGALRVLPDGDLLIADTAADQLMRVDPTSTRIDRTQTMVRSPLKMVPVPGVPTSLYVTSQTDTLYLVDTITGQSKVVDQPNFRLGGMAVDAKNRKLYLGGVGPGAVYRYDIGANGELSVRMSVAVQITQPTALALDACGGLYIAGADGGALRRLSPDGKVSVVADFPNGPDVTTLEFGSGKHGWSAQSLFALDTWNGLLYEVKTPN